MESVFERKELCCGCTACENSCPAGAISMVPDREGFLYPQIDQERCIDCGLCRQVCPFRSADRRKEAPFAHSYLAQHRSQEALMASTSGGAFTALSDAVLAQGGTVYGADFDPEWQVVHRRAETPSQRDRMRFSKYVQSDLRGVYVQVRQDLREGRAVLFTGTPCQCAGLRGFLEGENLSRLFLCDLICYGIPSPKIWESFQRMVEEERGGRVNHVQFRSKAYAWSRENSNKVFLIGTTADPTPRLDDRYYQLFFGIRSVVRPSCGSCPFADRARPTDLTIADYWGVEHYLPQYNDPRGVSLVLTSTSKGEELLRLAQKDLFTLARPAQECLSQQGRLREPVQLPPNREDFWRDYEEQGLAYALNKYRPDAR